jgi:hypothetical protein
LLGKQVNFIRPTIFTSSEVQLVLSSENWVSLLQLFFSFNQYIIFFVHLFIGKAKKMKKVHSKLFGKKEKREQMYEDISYS